MRSFDQSTIRPELFIYYVSKVAMLEPTIFPESNNLNTRSYQINKYSDYKLYLRNHKIELFTIELSMLAFISVLSDFCGLTMQAPYFAILYSTLNRSDSIEQQGPRFSAERRIPHHAAELAFLSAEFRDAARGNRRICRFTAEN